MKRRILAALLALCLLAGFFSTADAAKPRLDMCVDMEQLIAHARSMYLTLEGSYSDVTKDDNGAVSIGFLQWHGVNALNLLKMICKAAPDFSRETLGDELYNEVLDTPLWSSTNGNGWKNRILNDSEAAEVGALISSDIGIQYQNTYSYSFIRNEAVNGWNHGIRTEAALLYYCSVENQYGIGNARFFMSYVRETMGITENDTIDSLDIFHNAVLEASITYTSIRNYLNARKKVYNFLTGSLQLPSGREDFLPYLTELPDDGEKVVLFWNSTKTVLGCKTDSGRDPSLRAAAVLNADGALPYENVANGALIFTVHVTGSGEEALYSFENDGKYLALTEENAAAGTLSLIKRPSAAAARAYMQWSLVQISGGWAMVNAAAQKDGKSCCVELNGKRFRGAVYTVSAPARYAVNFFPLRDRTGGGFVQNPTGEAALGVDLSWFNGEVDWDLLAPEIDFAILRAAYTGNGEQFALAKDTTYDTNAAGCTARGVPFGVYYYGGATSVEQAREEAAFLLECLGTENLPTLPIFYDVYEPKNILKLDNEKLLEIVTAFCTAIEDAGFRAGVYATAYTWNTRLTDPAYGSWVRWTAQPGASDMTVNAGVNLWCYMNEGRMPGIETTVHLDYWLGELGDDTHLYGAHLCPAECEEDGLLACTCKLHENETSWLRLPALGHLWSDESGTEPPSCTQQGWSYHACLRCEARQRFDPVPALGHSWSKQTETVAPSCTLGGYTLRSCTRCGQTERIKETAALGHKWDKGTLIRQPSESREGLRQYRCTRCGGVKEESLACFRFADVKDASKPYYDAVYWAYWHSPEQITAGVSKTRFGPEQTVTRAQAMVFLWAAKNKPAPRSGSSPFADVKKGDWYYKAVLWAVENRITAGTDASHFSPGKTCSRAEILTFLYAAMGKPKVQISSPYRDVGSQWYQKAALWAYAKRIEKGEQGRFHPATPCTRAAIVSYLYRTLERKGLLN